VCTVGTSGQCGEDKDDDGGCEDGPFATEITGVAEEDDADDCEAELVRVEHTM